MSRPVAVSMARRNAKGSAICGPSPLFHPVERRVRSPFEPTWLCGATGWGAKPRSSSANTPDRTNRSASNSDGGLESLWGPIGAPPTEPSGDGVSFKITSGFFVCTSKASRASGPLSPFLKISRGRALATLLDEFAVRVFPLRVLLCSVRANRVLIYTGWWIDTKLGQRA